jgi:HEAT repeat protein
MLALDYIDDMLHQGKGAKVAKVIVNLASEGIINRDSAGGQVINNFPDVRARAVKDLGQIDTPQAKAALVNICQAEREPGVLYAAVNSLVKQTSGSPEQNITAIYDVYYRFNAGDMPDNRLALAVLNAFDFYLKNNQTHDKRLVNTLMAIKNDARYIYPVRARAEQLLQSFLASAKSGQSAG